MAKINPHDALDFMVRKSTSAQVSEEVKERILQWASAAGNEEENEVSRVREFLYEHLVGRTYVEYNTELKPIILTLFNLCGHRLSNRRISVAQDKNDGKDRKDQLRFVCNKKQTKVTFKQLLAICIYCYLAYLKLTICFIA
jgi:hypothetical protein